MLVSSWTAVVRLPTTGISWSMTTIIAIFANRTLLETIPNGSTKGDIWQLGFAYYTSINDGSENAWLINLG